MGKWYIQYCYKWLYPLHHDNIQQYTEIYHYLDNFNRTKITVDITISHIAITVITLSLLLHSSSTNIYT